MRLQIESGTGALEHGLFRTISTACFMMRSVMPFETVYKAFIHVNERSYLVVQKTVAYLIANY